MFKARTAEPTFYRTYSRLKSDLKSRENVNDVFDRTLEGLFKIGEFTLEEKQLCRDYLYSLKTFVSGRWLWIGGTPFIEDPNHFHAAYNCASINVDSIEDFGRNFNWLMMGCGVGSVLELNNLAKLPPITTRIDLLVKDNIGTYIIKTKDTIFSSTEDGGIYIHVGDSREGWVEAYMHLIRLATSSFELAKVKVTIDLGFIRPKGTWIKGFGGLTNPSDFRNLLLEVGEKLNSHIGKSWDSFIASWLLNRAAKCAVAGNIRRSARIDQGSVADDIFIHMKDNLWQQDENGKWRVDPNRDCLRMANQTAVYHTYPTREELKESISRQRRSGEGAIMFAPEAIARCNRDILVTQKQKIDFITIYCNKGRDEAGQYLLELGAPQEEIEDRLNRYNMNPCGEILGNNLHCDLSEVHLVNLDPFDLKDQENAFRVGALFVCPLLKHRFIDEKVQKSRELDPIVGVSITGLFDFFVKLFGYKWLEWWEIGRDISVYYDLSSKERVYFDRICELFDSSIDKYIDYRNNVYLGELFRDIEAAYMTYWRSIVEKYVTEYCDRFGLKTPTRFTTVQPAGTKSLLTGSSPGWHPPKASYFIRRITFAKNDPICLAAMECGYSVVPSQSNKDENGFLLNDPHDERCTEWLLEIPCQAPFGEVYNDVDPNGFSIVSQFDFLMQVQNNYTGHNTSSTVEIREYEIDTFADLLYDAIINNKGYVSTAVLARIDDFQSFPRLPFEPITSEKYKELSRDIKDTSDFYALLSRYQQEAGTKYEDERGSVACESDICAIKK